MPKSRPQPTIVYARTATMLIASAALVLPVILACERDDSLHRGRMFIEAGMYEEAVPVLRQAIQGKPNDPVAHLLLGTALLGTGDRSSAEEAFGRVTLLNPAMSGEIGHAYFRVASAKLQRSDHGSIREGSTLLQTAIERQPKLTDQASDLWTSRGTALTKANPPLAHLLLSAAQEANPDLTSDEKVQLGISLTTADIDERRGRLEEFVATFPNSDQLSLAFLELANCYYTQNRHDDAVARLEYIVGHFPNAAEANQANEMLSRMRASAMNCVG